MFGSVVKNPKSPFPGMREIVAVMIDGNLITTSKSDIAAAIRLNRPMQFLNRAHMRLMASFDLGPQWNRLADAPTLFCVDKDGLPVTDESDRASESKQ